MNPASTDKPTQAQLIFPLLEICSEAGGSAKSVDVADALAQRFVLPPSVVSASSSDARGNLWRRHVRHARRKAVAMGYLEPSAADGTWTLTDAGHEGLRHAHPAIVVELVVDPNGTPIGARIDIAMTVPTTHFLVRGDARNLSFIESNSIHLCVTSCPYFDLVEYQHDDAQLAEMESYEAFLSALDAVWDECYRVLTPGGRLALNVGDVLRSRRAHGEHHVLPLHAPILTRTVHRGFRVLTGIMWRKIGTLHAEGGGRGVLGQPGMPNGVVASGHEHILLLRKPVWEDIPGARRENGHPAPFNIRIPSRLIQMFSFVGGHVLDPFGGSGTTSVAAAAAGRNSTYVDCVPSYVEHAISRMRNAHRESIAA